MADEMDNAAVIGKALAQIKARAEHYQTCNDYYFGRQRLAFATNKFREAFAGLFQAFSDNLCPLVVDSVAERLQVTGFGVEEGAAALATNAWQVWQRNRMDERAGLVHRSALRCGDGYVIVWPAADGTPTIWPQQPEMMTVGYDDENPGVIEWAAKVWLDEKRARLNLYFPDRIEKYISKSDLQNGLSEKPDNFIPYQEPLEAWPLPNPYGVVPVFHFANNAWITDFGCSELASVIPLQDALNKAICDMLVSMEFTAFPQRWATGLELEIDPDTGKPVVPFKAGVDRVWSVASEAVRFGQFDPAGLEQFLRVQEALRTEIARVSGLPPHYINQTTGSHPSGDSLRASEARFVAKVRGRQTSFGNCWENVMALALRIGNVASDVRLTTQWQDASPISETELLNALLIKQQLGASDQQLLGEAGYGEQDIQRMMGETQAAAVAAAERQRQAFNSGLPPAMGA